MDALEGGKTTAFLLLAFHDLPFSTWRAVAPLPRIVIFGFGFFVSPLGITTVPPLGKLTTRSFPLRSNGPVPGKVTVPPPAVQIPRARAHRKSDGVIVPGFAHLDRRGIGRKTGGHGNGKPATWSDVNLGLGRRGIACNDSTKQ